MKLSSNIVMAAPGRLSADDLSFSLSWVAIELFHYFSNLWAFHYAALGPSCFPVEGDSMTNASFFSITFSLLGF